MSSQGINRAEMKELLDSLPDHAELPLVVTGHSMAPFFIHCRSTVFLYKDASYVPKRGDVVFALRPDGVFVLHRIHKILKDGRIRLNGDAQTWTELIYPSQIMAHVTHFIRTEGGKDRSMDSFRCRFVAWCWPSLRPIHAIHAKFSYYCRRLPYKLGIRKE